MDLLTFTGAIAEALAKAEENKDNLEPQMGGAIPPLENVREYIAKASKSLGEYFSDGMDFKVAKLYGEGRLDLSIEYKDGKINVWFQSPRPNLALLKLFNREITRISADEKVIDISIKGFPDQQVEVKS